MLFAGLTPGGRLQWRGFHEAVPESQHGGNVSHNVSVVGARRRLKSHLSDRLTWTGMSYLLLRFPLGIATFVIAVVLISVTGALLGAPAYYWVDEGIDFGIWQVDKLWKAIILTLIGIAAVFVALHLMNGTAFLSGKLARVMLGKMH